MAKKDPGGKDEQRTQPAQSGGSKLSTVWLASNFHGRCIWRGAGLRAQRVVLLYKGEFPLRKALLQGIHERSQCGVIGALNEVGSL